MIAISIVAALMLATPAGALISDTNVKETIVENEIIRRVTMEDSDATSLSLDSAHIDGSHVGRATVERVSVEGSYFNDLTIRRAFVENSRIERATVENSTLEDTTVCRAVVNNDFNFGDCESVSIEAGVMESHGRLAQDAPETIAPGQQYDLEVRDVDADTLNITNDPAGLVGLGFETEADLLGVQTLGFDAAASDDNVESIELWHDGELMETFNMGEEVGLPGEDFTLRVNTTDTGIIDHSRLALVLDLDGHQLRPQMTSFDVVATDLVIPAVEDQPLAPFHADDVANLVFSVGVDENGNVDRDLNISASIEVLDVDSGDDTLVSDMQDRANLHDDSRLFTTQPFTYREQVDAAHHPQTLELLVRAGLVPGLEQGAINAYATHVVVLSPYETDIRLDLNTTNAEGDTLNATTELTFAEAPEEDRTLEIFGNDFVLPGRGTLEVELVDSDGDSVDAGEDWSLYIEETPDSHGVSQSVAIDTGTSTVNQELSATSQVGTPFGNFVPSQYLVCVDHDDGRDCAQDGDLVTITTNETTTVQVEVE